MSTPSESNVPLEQSALVFEHSKNSTCETPLPASFAVAVNGVGLAVELLTLAAGAVIVTLGGTLSTRTFAWIAWLALPASSAAVARRS